MKRNFGTYALIVVLVFLALKGLNPGIADMMPTLNALVTFVVNLLEWAVHTVIGLFYSIFHYILTGTSSNYIANLLPSFGNIFKVFFETLSGLY